MTRSKLAEIVCANVPTVAPRRSCTLYLYSTLFILYVARGVTGFAQDTRFEHFQRREQLQCSAALNNRTSHRHKDVYRVGVLAIRGFPAAYREFNSTFSDYLTATAGARFSPPIRFELKPLNFNLLFSDTETSEVDFIYVNPSAYSCIESQFGAHSLVSQISLRKVGGQRFDLTEFGGVIFARADSGINTIQDIKGKSVACASISGLGSGQMQFRLLQQSGLSYINDPKQMVFTSNQGKVVNGVLNGEFDIGFVRTDQIERTKDASGKLVDVSKLKVIEPKTGLNIDGVEFPFQSSTQLYAEWNVAALTHVSTDVAEEVQTAMLSLAEHAAVGAEITQCYDNTMKNFESKILQPNACEEACHTNVSLTDLRCDTTIQIALLAHRAKSEGRYTGWRTTLSYMDLRNMQEETGFINRHSITGEMQCIRSSTIYDSITCPSGHFKKSEDDVLNGCAALNMTCAEDFQCVCQPCAKSFCRSGGYCPKNVSSDNTDGGFIPCPIGTYNSDTGRNNVTSCLPCPEGSYSDNRDGLVFCLQCPYRLGSGFKSPACPFCAENFYLKDPNITTKQLNMDPNGFCLECPANTTCGTNTTITTMKASTSKFWRLSNSTAKFYECESIGCQGDTTCAKGYDGVRCEVCTCEGNYFNASDGKCANCPFSRFGIIAGILASCILCILIGKLAFDRLPKIKDLLAHIATFLTNISLQAKFKIIISFFQVIITLEPIYGVRMHSAFTSWFDFLQIFNFGIAEALRIPNSCYGSMATRLSVNAGWPYALVFLLLGGIFIYAITIDMRKLRKKDALAKFLSRSLHVTIIVFYLVLPSVSRSIFDAKTCQSFASNDIDNKSQSYLRSDWSLQCDGNDHSYAKVQILFWVFFTAWSVSVPIVFLGLLLYIRPSVQTNRITPLAEACRFLWRDYERSTMYWEFIDVVRKICLTGFILFLDSEEGSDRILRLLVAILICVIYGICLSRARPYKRNDDLDLAILSNLLLTCCFVVSIIIHQCKEEDDNLENNTCESLFGRQFDSYKATLTAVILTASMPLLFGLFLVVLGVNSIGFPTIRLVSTNDTPRLELSPDCKDHMFFSHVWKSGQDKTHKIVRMLQQYLPGINIWLDIDSLTDIGNLEESVAEAARFVLFYSTGYFKSKNCVREVKAAIEHGKPITVIFESDENVENSEVINDMNEECVQYFPEGREYIFAEEPILWNNSSLHFTLESVKLIIWRLLQKLPHYVKHPLLLHNGLKIDNELSPVELLAPIELLVCDANIGAHEIASKLCREYKGTATISNMNLHDLSMQSTRKDRVMILYLNDKVFCGQDDQLHDSVKLLINEGVPIMSVHEKDTRKGGCPFETIIKQTPADLKGDLYNLYSSDIAVSLYSMKEYQQVSLRQILNNIIIKLPGLTTEYQQFSWNQSLKNIVTKLTRHQSKDHIYHHAEDTELQIATV